MTDAEIQALIQQLLNMQYAQGGAPTTINSGVADPGVQDSEADILLNDGRRNGLLQDYASMLMDPSVGLMTGQFDYMPTGPQTAPTPNTDGYLNGQDERAKTIAMAIKEQGMSAPMALDGIQWDTPEQRAAYEPIAQAIWDEKTAAASFVPQQNAAQYAASQAGLPNPNEIYSVDAGNVPLDGAYTNALTKRLDATGRQVDAIDAAKPAPSAWSVLAALHKQQSPNGWDSVIADQRALIPQRSPDNAVQNYQQALGDQSIYATRTAQLLNQDGRTPFTDMRDQRMAAMRQLLGM